MTGIHRHCLLIALTMCFAPAHAHEVRPAYLLLTEQNSGSWTVLWKKPLLEGSQLPLTPAFAPPCMLETSQRPENTGTATLSYFTANCPLHEAILTIEGLSATLTDVMVRVDRADGSTVSHLLRPENPSVGLSVRTPSATSYLGFGIEHLLFGIDHVLFVIGLVLLFPGRWELLKSITAFTLAHSLSLALSVLELVRVPQAPVEAIIALSILFLARELVVPVENRSVLTRTRPWIMSLLFGLLHGLGFAGVLAEIGLPRDQFALSLFLFNVGIEVGQLIVIALMLVVISLTARITTSLLPHKAGAWTMGSIAAMWTLDRVSGVFS